ncbi:MAG: pseudouridine synthase [Myxococcota bacterium]|nr:pseudouridine synthase [Myxococcota bacterium]
MSLILRRETDWLWLLKPAGLPVFPLHRDPGSDCVLKRLLAELPEQGECAWPEGFEGGLAHRLDIPTSGLVLAARSGEALLSARAAFSAKALTKTYRFLSGGELDHDQLSADGRCTLPIAHHPKSRRKMVVQRHARTRCRGKWYPADTRFRHLGGRRYEAVIVTGVMHQIRVHAAHCGVPLLGDTLYGGQALPAESAGSGPAFYLHHAHLAGLGSCPFTPPPVDWPA